MTALLFPRRSAAMMTALLLARPVFAALLVAVVGLYVWAGYKADADRHAGHEGRPRK